MFSCYRGSGLTSSTTCPQNHLWTAATDHKHCHFKQYRKHLINCWSHTSQQTTITYLFGATHFAHKQHKNTELFAWRFFVCMFFLNKYLNLCDIEMPRPITFFTFVRPKEAKSKWKNVLAITKAGRYHSLNFKWEIIAINLQNTNCPSAFMKFCK